MALVSRGCDPHLVTLGNVAICSHFPPHRPHLWRCGAHFVGLNARELPWEYEGRNGSAHIRDHWRRHRNRVRVLAGVVPSPASPQPYP